MNDHLKKVITDLEKQLAEIISQNDWRMNKFRETEKEILSLKEMIESLKRLKEYNE